MKKTVRLLICSTFLLLNGASPLLSRSLAVTADQVKVVITNVVFTASGQLASTDQKKQCIRTGKVINASPRQPAPCEKTRSTDKATEGDGEKEMVAAENESTIDQTARRAACSSAVSKAKSNRRASATVKLVSY